MKKFLKNRIADLKFLGTGPGHSLTENTRSQPQSTPPATAEPRRTPSESAAAAGQAALSRVEQQSLSTGRASDSRKKSAGASSGSTAIDPQKIREEVIQEAKSSPETSQTVQAPSLPDEAQPPQEKDTALNSVHVQLVCPLCQRLIPHLDIREHLGGCLMESYCQDPIQISAKMIHTLCVDQEKKKACMDALCRYIDNVVSHPEEEKYRKIKASNKVFQEKVSAVPGAVLFIEAVGFEQHILSQGPGAVMEAGVQTDSTEEMYFVLPNEKATNVQVLQQCKETLMSTEPVNPKLDRNLQVFKGSSRINQFNLTNDFYNLTVDEIKREQKLRAEAAEREGMLRTKAMREKDEMRMTIRHYRYVLLRVRLPDGIILQGVFRPLEKVADVRMFVVDALENPQCLFTLASVGKILDDDTATLVQLELVPTAVLNLTFDTTVVCVQPPYLKAELIARLQTLPV